MVQSEGRNATLTCFPHLLLRKRPLTYAFLCNICFYQIARKYLISLNYRNIANPCYSICYIHNKHALITDNLIPPAADDGQALCGQSLNTDNCSCKYHFLDKNTYSLLYQFGVLLMPQEQIELWHYRGTTLDMLKANGMQKLHRVQGVTWICSVQDGVQQVRLSRGMLNILCDFFLTKRPNSVRGFRTDPWKSTAANPSVSAWTISSSSSSSCFVLFCFVLFCFVFIFFLFCFVFFAIYNHISNYSCSIILQWLVIFIENV